MGLADVPEYGERTGDNRGAVFLETASEKKPHSVTDQRAQRLRAAMGVHSQHGWCLVDGCRIAWEETQTAAREAQPVLCLHGAGGGSREFRPVMERCPAGSRLILFDWPSHGRSGDLSSYPSYDPSCDPADGSTSLTVEHCAKIVETLVDQLGIDRPILLGSGFGAAVAIRFAADHPGQALGLVLCQPEGLVSASGLGPFAGSLCGKRRRGFHNLLRRMKKFAPRQTGKEANAARQQALRMEALQPMMQPVHASARTTPAIGDRSRAALRSALGSLPCPALFALSHDNKEYPLRKYLALLDPSLASAPQHQFTIFAGAFNPIWDEPDRFSQALTSFIQAQVPVEKHTHAWLLNAVDWPTRDNNLWKCVHPDCDAERVLPTGQNANETPRVSKASK